MPATEPLLSITTPLGPDALELTALAGEERLSGLFRFHLTLRSARHDLDLRRLVGQAAAAGVRLAGGGRRWFHGVLGRCAQVGSEGSFALYSADLYPALWLLTLSAGCRIFQNRSVPQIVEQVLSAGGIGGARSRLAGSYPARELAVQYNETAYDFVARLLADEGIFFFFEHGAAGHTLVLADDSAAAAPCPGGAALRFGSHGVGEQQDLVTRCAVEESLVPASYTLCDFSFETPAADLTASAAGRLPQSLARGKVWEYPGGYTKLERGEGRARRRLEAEELPARLLRGDSRCPALLPGHRFELAGHVRKDLNAPWVVASVAHRATADGYTNTFEALPLATPYRPRREIPRPVIPGSQTALVVGSAGEEIHTDRHGRVKVRFHWDPEGQRKDGETASCWIRVAQGWAGKGWGQLFLPRVGQEVVVSFLDGDPDRPLITGAVYNGEQTVPYPLPASRTRSTIKSAGSKDGEPGNEIRFEDRQGDEELYLHARKDLRVQVRHDRAQEVGHDDSLVIQGDRRIDVRKGTEEHTVAGTRRVEVRGDEAHGNGAGYRQTVQGSFVLEVKGDLTIRAGGALRLQGATVASVAERSLTSEAGTSLTNQAGTALTNKAGTSLTNEAGTTLTSKATLSQNVESSGVLIVKGSLVKIN